VHAIDTPYAPETTRVLAVVGILFEEVDDTYAETTFFDLYDVTVLATAFDLNFKEALFGEEEVESSNFNFYAYQGSLTTPPCDETVNWYLLMQPRPIKSSHLTLVKDTFQDNPTFAGGNGDNRLTQPLNDRLVSRHTLNGCVNRMTINTYLGAPRVAFTRTVAILLLVALIALFL
jgi:carbonic anhydrase